jgi:hypothetical protein
MTSRLSNHLVSSQIVHATENMTMLVSTKNVQSSTLYMTSPVFFMINQVWDQIKNTAEKDFVRYITALTYSCCLITI